MSSCGVEVTLCQASSAPLQDEAGANFWTNLALSALKFFWVSEVGTLPCSVAQSPSQLCFCVMNVT